MAERHWFGRSPSDWVFDVGTDNTAVLQGNVSLTAWNQPSGGVQYTDLLDVNGNAVAELTSSNGGALPLGVIPQFQAPPGITSLWIQAAGGVRFLMTATDLGALEERVATLEATVAVQQTLLAHALYGVKYDSGIGAYPAIPEQLAGQKYLIFIGPPAPTTARAKDLHIDTVE